jgi:hypothetical protein
LQAFDSSSAILCLFLPSPKTNRQSKNQNSQNKKLATNNM